MQSQSLAGSWLFRQAGTQEWQPAQVPGGVHTDLLALNAIPDPFRADNEWRVQWVAESDWDYRLTFNVAAELLKEETLWLVCDGLDTLATVVLDGEIIGAANNMFRQFRWDVKSLLVDRGPHELEIRFPSPVRFAAEKMAVESLPGVPEAIPGGPYLRKAPCQFGWDWGPQLPPIGIWKDIRLEAHTAARIGDLHLRQEHTAGQVTVTARVIVDRLKAAPAVKALTARVRISAPDGGALEETAEVSADGRADLRVSIPRPQLWWPNGYGSQPLYQVEITLEQDGAALDRRGAQIGLRTIELHQEKDEWGRSFVFVVNGQPIFAKGSNWIPADSFPTRITTERLEWLIRSAAETHQNMLRVWGGGFYEDERFYDLCDRYGILVWQDFIFSCSVYPLTDPEFLENVHAEVVQNVRRLRHRASLALWCGNNEMEQGWCEWEWMRGDHLAHLRAAYDSFFHQTLPAWCHAEDPDHDYWPSSPSSDTPITDPNGQIQGDAHYWDVWHKRKPFTAYRDQYPRFMSEFGFQALPPLATIATYADRADWNMTSYIMEQHQKNASGNSLMVGQMLDTFRLPKDFESLVYLSMVLQAEGIRYGVEHWRRHGNRVAGTLYWQLNDCWPVASWSSLDYYGRWKALHYAARRFYAPMMLSIEDEPARQGIFLTSDLSRPWNGSVHWSLETLDGEILDGGKEVVWAAPQVTTHVCTLDFSKRLNLDGQREWIFVAELRQGDQRVDLKVATFVPTKHLSLRDPAIQSSLRRIDGRLVIDLEAQSLARLVEVSLDGQDAVFSDNYFDLPAGRAVRIDCAYPEGWTLAQVQEALKVRSVYNSYA
ncbi:MAG TPA: glycoside hydrolase family 2 protein [Anaerolineaceae bacterium]|nr:glycoside hydrolase family 2 protein [Anaerolineaceae bacterium]